MTLLRAALVAVVLVDDLLMRKRLPQYARLSAAA